MSEDQSAATPDVVRALSTAEARELANLVGVFEDLQYVLQCCEHLVTALVAPESGPVQVQSDPVLLEALWTGALVGYVRCFSKQSKVLTEDDVKALELDGDVTSFHKATISLRDHFASRHVNPRETFTIGAAEGDGGAPEGVAVVATPQPQVDDTTVRLLGRIAYGLSAVVDARIQLAQRQVLAAATEMPATEFAALPTLQLATSA